MKARTVPQELWTNLQQKIFNQPYTTYRRSLVVKSQTYVCIYSCVFITCRLGTKDFYLLLRLHNKKINKKTLIFLCWMSHRKLCNLYDSLLPQERKKENNPHCSFHLTSSFLYAVVVLRQAISLTQGHEFSLLHFSSYFLLLLLYNIKEGVEGEMRSLLFRHFHHTNFPCLTPHFASSNEIIDRYKNKSFFLSLLWDSTVNE